MGRRGLSRSVKRVPPPPEALAHYLDLWTWEAETEEGFRLPRVESPALFGDDRPLELEVGCGTGEYLCALAAQAPERNFLGLDPSTKSLYLAVRQAAASGLRNIHFFRAPAVALYPYLVDGALDAIYVHFPDPFVRSRNQHKVLNPLFLSKAHAALRTGGVLSIVSDKPELFHEALALVEAADGWQKTHAERFLVGFDPPVKSRYQLKWERYDVQALRLEVRRAAPAAARAS